MKSFIQIPVNGCTSSFELSDTPSVCGILFFMALPKINKKVQSDEIWKDIPGYEEYYSASSLGRIRREGRTVKNPSNRFIKGRIIKPFKSGYGYLSFDACREGKEERVCVHRAVALAFLEREKSKTQVNHINGIKEDNRIENLEWVTNSENCIHAYRTGLSNKKRGGFSQKAIIILQYSLSGVLVKEWASIVDAAQQFEPKYKYKNTKSNISHACRGKLKTCMGYVWKYKSPPQN